MLIKEIPKTVFDTEQISIGMLMYAKHKTWTNGERGFITAVDEELIIVQYFPGISNVTNHMKIPIEEVTAGEWEIRWSKDLSEVFRYPE